MANQKGQVSAVLGKEVSEVVRYLQDKWQAHSAGEVVRRLLLMSPEVQKAANELNLTLPDPAFFKWGGDRKSADKDETTKEEA